MSGLYHYPPKAEFGRVVPKAKIYDHAGANTALKDLFISQVEQISWTHKLAPETTNLPATKAVAEIQVFAVALKTADLDARVLRAMDEAIASPIIFELAHKSKRKMMAAFKEPTENGWTVSDYFASAWVDEATPRLALPVALDLGQLYAALLAGLMPVSKRANEDISGAVARAARIKVLEKDIARTTQALNREKQFNARVEVNASLRQLQRELTGLKNDE
jgi:hypothetical protein